MIIIKITSRCIGRKTEARGGNGEIPAAARGDGMIGGGTPDHHDDFDDDDFDDDDFYDDDDFEKNYSFDRIGFYDNDANLEQLLSGVCVDEQRTGKATLLINSLSILGPGIL